MRRSDVPYIGCDSPTGHRKSAADCGHVSVRCAYIGCGDSPAVHLRTLAMHRSDVPQSIDSLRTLPASGSSRWPCRSLHIVCDVCVKCALHRVAPCAECQREVSRRVQTVRHKSAHFRAP